MCHPGESCIRISDSLMAGFGHADWKSSYSIPSDDTSEGTEPCLRNPFRNALKGSRERTPFRPRADSFPWSATLLSAPGYPLQGFSSLPGEKKSPLRQSRHSRDWGQIFTLSVVYLLFYCLQRGSPTCSSIMSSLVMVKSPLAASTKPGSASVATLVWSLA